MDTPSDLAGDEPQSPDLGDRAAAAVICKSIPGLVAQQVEVCQHFPDTITSVADGARRGIQECQYQFRHERWNCSTSEDQSVFGYSLQRGK